jgi:cell wall-associated NlpC family hydrolase
MANVDLTIEHRAAVQALRAAMLKTAADWRGTPYLLGGNTKQGIDCSHFVYQVLNEARKACSSGFPVPQVVNYRNTATMESSHLWFPTKMPEPGDLVMWDGHAGIIVGNGRFVGAQSSTGVAEATHAGGYWAGRSAKRFLRFVHCM